MRLPLALPLPLLAACAAPYAPPRPCPPAPPAVAPAPAPTVKAAPPKQEKIAVLPLRDDELFRAERAELRAHLHESLTQRLPQHEVLPLAKVDEVIAPVSSSGARCALRNVDAARRAKRYPWGLTSISHVLGTEGRPEELWVGIDMRGATVARFKANFDPKLDLRERYRSAFSALVVNEDFALSGGLLGDLTVATPKGAHACVWKGFRCTKDEAFTNARAALNACFEGEAETSVRLLVDPATKRCELVNVDETTGPRAQHEACLCRAVASVSAVPERHRVRVGYVDPAIADRPRPALRVLEAAPSLYPAYDTQYLRDEKRSLARLAVPGLDGLRGPLARCKAKPGATLIADVTVSPLGVVEGATFVAGDRALAACAERELAKGRFDCPNGKGSATMRVAATWPASGQ